MKQLFLTSLILVLSVSLSAQEYFVGDMILKTDVKIETDVDAVVEATLKNMATNADPLASAMAKSMVRSTVVNMMKQQELMKYVNAFPNGEYSQVVKYDGKNNRTVSFCPELGRIVIRDFDKGLIYVAFPKLKIACKEVEYMHRSKEPQRNAIKTRLPYPTEEVNGTMCVPFYSYQEYAKVGGDKSDTITINGVLYKKGENCGWAYADFPLLPFDALLKDEYGTMKTQTLQIREKEIDPDNFVLPEGYKVYDELIKLAGKLNAIVKKQDISIPFDGQIPDNIWLVIQ